VHERFSAFCAAVPVQLWGPLNVIFPLLSTLPLKPSKGGANESVHCDSDTTAFMPISEASQCAATVQVPATLGQAPLALPPPAEFDGESLELELHARARVATKNRIRLIVTV
jgi:hypothetical protein